MDFLSKINANAGIDVKKGEFVAENATVTNFEVRDAKSAGSVTTISSDKVEFNNSEFAVNAVGVTIISNNGLPAELNMLDGEINLDIGASHIEMNTEFLELYSRDMPMNIKYNSNDGINIISGDNDLGKLSFNTEFFKLHYSNPFNNAGPVFEITSTMANSYPIVQGSLPTAEIKSQRLDISAYSKNLNNIPGNITLHVTPAEFVDNTTKEPINNDHDAVLKVDESGIHLDAGCNTVTEPVIELSTRKPDGIVDINSGNITMLAEQRTNGGNVVGGEFEVSSYTSNINSDSYINMAAVNASHTASIRISSTLDKEDPTVKISGGIAEINTTEFLVNAAENIKIDTSEFLVNTSEFLVNTSGSLKFTGTTRSRFTFTGNVVEVDTSEFIVKAPAGITFDGTGNGYRKIHTNENLCIEAEIVRFTGSGTGTNGVFIDFKNYGGCMSFTRNGISVNTTPESGTGQISGNVLLSKSLRSIERMTQSEYDAIETKDENTLYIIAG